jgi:hypothetical protein
MTSAQTLLLCFPLHFTDQENSGHRVKPRHASNRHVSRLSSPPGAGSAYLSSCLALVALTQSNVCCMPSGERSSHSAQAAQKMANTGLHQFSTSSPISSGVKNVVHACRYVLLYLELFPIFLVLRLAVPPSGFCRACLMSLSERMIGGLTDGVILAVISALRVKDLRANEPVPRCKPASRRYASSW